MIVCTGPISSGTRLLTEIVRGIAPDEEVVHRSMPHWDQFWDWDEFDTGTSFVVITRRPDVSARSAYNQRHGDPTLLGTDGKLHWAHFDHRLTVAELDGWWELAMQKLAAIPVAHWLSYEALVANQNVQISAIAKWLGYESYGYTAVPQVFDGNRKWKT